MENWDEYESSCDEYEATLSAQIENRANEGAELVREAAATAAEKQALLQDQLRTP